MRITMFGLDIELLITRESSYRPLIEEDVSPLFHTAELMMSSGVRKHLVPEDVQIALGRHYLGDWGHVGDPMSMLNEASLSEHAGVLFSLYHAFDQVEFVVESNLGKDTTRVMLMTEYVAEVPVA